MGPLVTATLQGSTMSAISNVLGQYLEARLTSVRTRSVLIESILIYCQRPFVLNIADVLRFFLLHICTAPPNYRWQEFLDRHFPARAAVDDHVTLPLHELDRKRAPMDDMETQPTRGSSWLPARLRRTPRGTGRLNVRNTLVKWALDCLTVGALCNTGAFLIIMGILKAQSADKIMTNLKTETFRIIVAGWRVWPIASIISFSLIPVERRILFFSTIGLGWNIYMRVFAASLMRSLKLMESRTLVAARL